MTVLARTPGPKIRIFNADGSSALIGLDYLPFGHSGGGKAAGDITSVPSGWNEITFTNLIFDQEVDENPTLYDAGGINIAIFFYLMRAVLGISPNILTNKFYFQKERVTGLDEDSTHDITGWIGGNILQSQTSEYDRDILYERITKFAFVDKGKWRVVKLNTALVGTASEAIVINRPTNQIYIGDNTFGDNVFGTPVTKLSAQTDDVEVVHLDAQTSGLYVGIKGITREVKVIDRTKQVLQRKNSIDFSESLEAVTSEAPLAGRDNLLWVGQSHYDGSSHRLTAPAYTVGAGTPVANAGKSIGFQSTIDRASGLTVDDDDVLWALTSGTSPSPGHIARFNTDNTPPSYIGGAPSYIPNLGTNPIDWGIASSGDFLFISYRDSTLRVFNKSTSRLVHTITLSALRADIIGTTPIALSAYDGKLYITYNGKLYIFDIEDDGDITYESMFTIPLGSGDGEVTYGGGLYVKDRNNIWITTYVRFVDGSHHELKVIGFELINPTTTTKEGVEGYGLGRYTFEGKLIEVVKTPPGAGGTPATQTRKEPLESIERNEGGDFTTSDIADFPGRGLIPGSEKAWICQVVTGNKRKYLGFSVSGSNIERNEDQDFFVQEGQQFSGNGVVIGDYIITKDSRRGLRFLNLPSSGTPTLARPTNAGNVPSSGTNYTIYASGNRLWAVYSTGVVAPYTVDITKLANRYNQVFAVENQFNLGDSNFVAKIGNGYLRGTVVGDILWLPEATGTQMDRMARAFSFTTKARVPSKDFNIGLQNIVFLWGIGPTIFVPPYTNTVPKILKAFSTERTIPPTEASNPYPLYNICKRIWSIPDVKQADRPIKVHKNTDATEVPVDLNLGAVIDDGDHPLKKDSNVRWADISMDRKDKIVLSTYNELPPADGMNVNSSLIIIPFKIAGRPTITIGQASFINGTKTRNANELAFVDEVGKKIYLLNTSDDTWKDDSYPLYRIDKVDREVEEQIRTKILSNIHLHPLGKKYISSGQVLNNPLYSYNEFLPGVNSNLFPNYINDYSMAIEVGEFRSGIWKYEEDSFKFSVYKNTRDYQSDRSHNSTLYNKGLNIQYMYTPTFNASALRTIQGGPWKAITSKLSTSNRHELLALTEDNTIEWFRWTGTSVEKARTLTPTGFDLVDPTGIEWIGNTLYICDSGYKNDQIQKYSISTTAITWTKTIVNPVRQEDLSLGVRCRVIEDRQIITEEECIDIPGPTPSSDKWYSGILPIDELSPGLSGRNLSLKIKIDHNQYLDIGTIFLEGSRPRPRK